MRNFRTLATIWAAILLVAGCGEKLQDRAIESAPADLTFSVSIPAISVGTRAGYADGAVSPADTVGWKRWELLVDGQSMYRLTLFLININETPSSPTGTSTPAATTAPTQAGRTDSARPTALSFLPARHTPSRRQPTSATCILSTATRRLPLKSSVPATTGCLPLQTTPLSGPSRPRPARKATPGFRITAHPSLPLWTGSSRRSTPTLRKALPISQPTIRPTRRCSIMTYAPSRLTGPTVVRPTSSTSANRGPSRFPW